jgi:hypothetical protein
MKLKYQEELGSIENCPVENIKGEITLFRCVESPMDENSFIPNAVLLKPKYQQNCMAWGLSLFRNYNTAKQMLNNLSKKKLVKYSDVAKGILTDEDGVKNCNKKSKKHYTFYPKENLDIVSKFAIVQDYENE